MATTGSPDTAIVMRSGADSEMVSILSRDDVRIIGDTVGVRRGSSGAIASAELFVIVDVLKRDTGTVANVALRGVGPNAFAVRDRVKIVAGRMFQAGRNELIRQGRGRDLSRSGPNTKWGANQWTVVGIFDTGGT